MTHPDDRPEGRPAPLYGEYAPEGWVSPAASIDPAEPVPVPESRPAPGAAAAREPRRWDRLLTIGLLAFGTVSVFSSIGQYANLPATLDLVFAEFGAGDYSADELARTIGMLANVTQIVLLVGAFVLALRALSTGRLAFIYPLAAGLLAAVLLVIYMAIAMTGDPAFLESIQPTAPPPAE